jgi:DNA repair protein RadA/Sms
VKPSREKIVYVCQECGADSPKWAGQCPGCGVWNRMVEETRRPATVAKSFQTPAAPPVRLRDVDISAVSRLQADWSEWDTVLGGGIVPGSLILVGGDPGIGKSTLLMQVAFRLAAQGRKILYVSGEESGAQIKLRANRLGQPPEQLYLFCETDIEAVLDAARNLNPDLVIVDSIQTLSRAELSSVPGSVGQVRECGAALMGLAKNHGPAVVLVGHVTKEGVLAGPRILEHMVDTVVYFEGDRQFGYRMLRSVKNRFGATHEVGFFDMRSDGLTQIGDPSRLFLQDRHIGSSGTAIGVSLEGTRPLLIEIQALVAQTHFGLPQRRISGLDYNRSILIMAVLERRAGLPLGTQDAFVSVVGGMSVTEPALDLTVAVAMASSFRDIPLDSETVFFGEIGLGGEIRGVSQPERRVQEARQLGFKRCLLPAHNAKVLAHIQDVDLVGVDTLGQALALCFPEFKKRN